MFRIRPIMSWTLFCFICVVWPAALPAQTTHFLKITPEKATLLVGESKTFRMVDQNGQMQRNIVWNISDSGAFEKEEGDELVVTAKQRGDFTISAHNSDGSAEASIKVMEGTTLPEGTAKWTGTSVEGCKTIKVIPAVPSANGPDIFEQSQCADGSYVTAYTEEGIQLWRRKVSNAGPVPSGGSVGNEQTGKASLSGGLNVHATSVCDLLAIGAEQQKIREILKERNLSFSELHEGGSVWLIEESNKHCKLWFDEKATLTRKSKIFVND
jgi:hypothetical protein